jgi:diguanylate cyclase (GGDEF)-like protein/PAS domain S-box-containing protein
VSVTNHTDKHPKEIADLYAQITELDRKNKELSKQIRINESLYRNVLDALPMNIFLENPEGQTIFANKQACQVNGRNLDELYGKTVFDFFPQAIAQANRDFDLEVWKQRRLITKEILAGFKGKEHHMYTGKTIIHINESGDDFLLGFALDITDRVKTEELLRESEEKFRSVIEQAADSIFLINMDGTIIEVNPTACESLHYSKDELIQMSIERVFTSLACKLPRVSAQGSTLSNFEDTIRGKDHQQIPVDVNIRLIQIGKKQMYLAICRDIREKKRAEAQIKHMAYNDALTNLPNRWHIQSFFQNYLENTDKNAVGLGLILLDLDRFKVINDSLGHDAGDLLLKEVARRLQLVTVKRETFLARFGGDEFVMLVPQLTGEEEIFTVCEEVMSILRVPFEISGQKFSISASIGISQYPKDGVDLATLIKNADLAMYDTKEQGRNGYSIFTQTLKQQAMERMGLEILLREALVKDEFFLHYQPKVHMATGQIYGVEALIRWKNGCNEIFYPNSFIHVAEETGLMIPIGEWVIREACRQCKVWHEAGYPQLTVSVNLSPKQFQNKRLEAFILTVLKETGLPPGSLELELTEGMIMKQPEKAVVVLNNLKSLGIKISIDDFGTGFSSLSYLPLFPIDNLKIDQSFIMHLEMDQSNAAIASTVISLAHSLNLKVVAEGIESEEQYHYLLEQNCDFAQGYYISKPSTPEEITKKLVRNLIVSG